MKQKKQVRQQSADQLVNDIVAQAFAAKQKKNNRQRSTETGVSWRTTPVYRNNSGSASNGL